MFHTTFLGPRMFRAHSKSHSCLMIPTVQELAVTPEKGLSQNGYGEQLCKYDIQIVHMSSTHRPKRTKQHLFLYFHAIVWQMCRHIRKTTWTIELVLSSSVLWHLQPRVISLAERNTWDPIKVTRNSRIVCDAGLWNVIRCLLGCYVAHGPWHALDGDNT